MNIRKDVPRLDILLAENERASTRIGNKQATLNNVDSSILIFCNVSSKLDSVDYTDTNLHSSYSGIQFIFSAIYFNTEFRNSFNY